MSSLVSACLNGQPKCLISLTGAPHLPPARADSIQHGVDPNFAFYSLSILNAASVFGRIIPNWLADTYGPLTILFPNCLLSGVLIFCWLPLAKSVAGLVVFALLFGFTSGAYVSTMPACVAVMTDDMGEIGVRIAMAFLGISVAALVGSKLFSS